MHDAMVSHECQRLEHLTCEPSDQCSTKSNEAVRLDELIKIDTEQLHRYTQVIAEVKVFSHLDNMMFLVRILYALSEH